MHACVCVRACVHVCVRLEIRPLYWLGTESSFYLKQVTWNPDYTDSLQWLINWQLDLQRGPSYSCTKLYFIFLYKHFTPPEANRPHTPQENSHTTYSRIPILFRLKRWETTFDFVPPKRIAAFGRLNDKKKGAGAVHALGCELIWLTISVQKSCWRLPSDALQTRIDSIWQQWKMAWCRTKERKTRRRRQNYRWPSSRVLFSHSLDIRFLRVFECQMNTSS